MKDIMLMLFVSDHHRIDSLVYVTMCRNVCWVHVSHEFSV